MAMFEIWKRGKAYEVIFREGSGISYLSRTGSLAEAKKRLAYHRNRRKNGYLLKEDRSVWEYPINVKAKLKKVM